MAEDRVKAFAELFDLVAARGADAPRMEAFARSLSFADVKACLDLYMAIYPAHAPRGPGSLRTFVALVMAGLDRGDLYFALTFEARVQAKDGPWVERFRALGEKERGWLIRAAKAWRRHLSKAQAGFLQLFEAAMRSRSSAATEASLAARSAHALAECLEAYLAVSQRWPDDEPTSIRIFHGLSLYALRAGEADFATSYLGRVGAGGVMSRRFTRLTPAQQKELADAARAAAGRATAADAARPDKPPPLAATAAIRAFSTWLRAFMRAPAATGQDDYRQVSDYIINLSPAGLRECFEAFLRLSPDYPAASPRAATIYWGLASRLAHRGQAYDAMKIRFLVELKTGAAATRHAALDARTRAKLEAELQAAIARPRILDRLKLEYYQKSLRDPSPADLLRFARVRFTAWESVEGAIVSCENAFHKDGDPAAFSRAFDVFAGIFAFRTSVWTILWMLQTCRETLKASKLVKAELYWLAVLALYDQARVENPQGYYEKGFDLEEEAFLLDSAGLSPAYRYDFEQRFDYIRQPRVSRQQLIDSARAHAVLMHIAMRMDANLVGMDRTAEIHGDLLALAEAGPEALEALTVPVNARFGPRELSLGMTIGEAYLVWWDRGRGRAYVEIASAPKGVLFEVDAYITLGRMSSDDASFGAIWRANKGLIEIIQAFFDALGFLVDLAMIGGFADLVENVLVDLLGEAIAERMDLSAGQALALTFLLGMVTGSVRNRLLQGNRGLDALDLDDLARGTARVHDPGAAPTQRLNMQEARALDRTAIDMDAPSVPTRPGPRRLPPAPEAPIGGTRRLTPGEARALDRTAIDVGEPRLPSRVDADAPGVRPDADGGPKVRETVDDFAAAKAKSKDPRRSRDWEDAVPVSSKSGTKSGSGGKKKTAREGHGQGEEGAKGVDKTRGKTWQAPQQPARPSGGRRTEPPPPAPASGLIVSPYYARPLIVGHAPPVMQQMGHEGFQPRMIGAHRGRGGEIEAFQRVINPSGLELALVDPRTKLVLNIDAPAIDPLHPDMLVIGEVKATYVGHQDKTPHWLRDREKAQGLAKQLTFPMLRPDRFRIELILNAPLVPGEGHIGMLGEVYLNLLYQSAGEELIARYPQVAWEYASRVLRKEYNSISHKEVRSLVHDQLIDDFVTISVLDFGRVKAPKD